MCELQTNNENLSFGDIELGFKSILDEPFHPFFGKLNIIWLFENTNSRRKNK